MWKSLWKHSSKLTHDETASEKALNADVQASECRLPFYARSFDLLLEQTFIQRRASISFDLHWLVDVYRLPLQTSALQTVSENSLNRSNF